MSDVGDAVVAQALLKLKAGLAPYLQRELKEFYGAAWWDDGVERYLRENSGLDARQATHLTPEQRFLRLDVQALLTLFSKQWTKVWGHPKRLPKKLEAYVLELRDVRNRIAHQQSVDDADTHRALDTMHRLLEAVGAANEAEAVKDLIQRHLHGRTSPTNRPPGNPADQAPRPRAVVHLTAIEAALALLANKRHLVLLAGLAGIVLLSAIWQGFAARRVGEQAQRQTPQVRQPRAESPDLPPFQEPRSQHVPKGAAEWQEIPASSEPKGAASVEKLPPPEKGPLGATFQPLPPERPKPSGAILLPLPPPERPGDKDSGAASYQPWPFSLRRP